MEHLEVDRLEVGLLEGRDREAVEGGLERGEVGRVRDVVAGGDLPGLLTLLAGGDSVLDLVVVEVDDRPGRDLAREVAGQRTAPGEDGGESEGEEAGDGHGKPQGPAFRRIGIASEGDRRLLRGGVFSEPGTSDSATHVEKGEGGLYRPRDGDSVRKGGGGSRAWLAGGGSGLSLGLPRSGLSKVVGYRTFGRSSSGGPSSWLAGLDLGWGPRSGCGSVRVWSADLRSARTVAASCR